MIRVLLLVLFTLPVLADDQRAHINYMLHCQGCHLPQAEGVEGRVPPMKNFVGWFAHSDEGRAFLIRVPGVATSALDNNELAELMNWLLKTYSLEQLPASFDSFSANEVGRLRDSPVSDPERLREEILNRIANQVPAAAKAMESGP